MTLIIFLANFFIHCAIFELEACDEVYQVQHTLHSHINW